MSTPTVADIFRESFGPFVAQHGPQPLHHLRVVNAITNCRTAALGGQHQRCNHCGHEHALYHSCRDRHCPRCQSGARLAWVQQRIEESLPVGYFHVVFTIPQQLNPFAIRNRKAFYELLFQAVRETLLELAADSKRLGADIGFIAVLHTWGQNLSEHPHIHCIVAGGGFDIEHNRWKPSGDRFLFPVSVVRKLYRGKLMAFFREALQDGRIMLHGSLQAYADPIVLHALIDRLYRTEWVVHIEAPFASPKALVKYLGQYTHRVAISNNRIIHADQHTVTFSYKDYADNGRRKTMTLSTTEFIRRFLLHVLPQGFRKIRYYGFLAVRARKTRLAACRKFFNRTPPQRRKTKRSCVQIIKELTGVDPAQCPVCKLGTLLTVALFQRVPQAAFVT
jgi:predicted Zn-ribbon and HTH transcriptional regulator